MACHRSTTVRHPGSGSWLVAVLALGCANPAPTGQTSAGTAGVTSSSSTVSNRATDQGLEIWFEVRPEVRADRVPLRVVVLHFHNVSSEPVRVYLPRGEAFRAGLSTLHFRAGDAVFVEPEPLPHGVVIEEADFPLIAPGEVKTFEQTFTLDPMQAGKGTNTARRRGFEDGASAHVTWTYQSSITRWAGGHSTLDGPTKSLFGGGDIPHLWTGKLTVQADWVIR